MGSLLGQSGLPSQLWHVAPIPCSVEAKKFRSCTVALTLCPQCLQIHFCILQAVCPSSTRIRALRTGLRTRLLVLLPRRHFGTMSGNLRLGADVAGGCTGEAERIPAGNLTAPSRQKSSGVGLCMHLATRDHVLEMQFRRNLCLNKRST